jgi:hypothetical protein
LLVAGWAAGLPVPFLLAYASAWGWIVTAKVLLGVNQGLAGRRLRAAAGARADRRDLRRRGPGPVHRRDPGHRRARGGGSRQPGADGVPGTATTPSFWEILLIVSWRSRSLRGASQARAG